MMEALRKIFISMVATMAVAVATMAVATVIYAVDAVIPDRPSGAEPSFGVGRLVPDEPSETLEKVPEPAAELVSIGDYRLTAYCPCPKCCGKWAYNRPTDAYGNEIVYTATGEVAEAGKTIAVDPAVIPYGTEVVINGNTYTADDCGGAIDGNRIDVYMDDHADALAFGVQYATVYVKGGM